MIVDQEVTINIVRRPQNTSVSDQVLLLSSESKVYGKQEALQPLMELFAEEISAITGKGIGLTNDDDSRADIVFELEEELAEEEYKIEVTDVIEVEGGSYAALAMARSTLLQMVFVEDSKLAFPVVTIEDAPDLQYRGLMIDLARNWHTVDNLKKLIDMASFYKNNYVHLHFTDYQSYTLPSRKYPNLSTKDRHYSFEDLEELERYSQLKGITIIPEIDIPGHASSIVQAYPELFGLKDIKENPWTINMGKEEVYTALEEILSELIPIFKSTPYIHIGGDEAIFHKVGDDPEVQAYMKANDLGDDVHELYRQTHLRLNR